MNIKVLVGIHLILLLIFWDWDWFWCNFKRFNFNASIHPFL